MLTYQSAKSGTVVDCDAGQGWWARLVTWIAEARAHRVVCLVCGIWLLNAFDLAFTLLSHEQGVLHEQNPLARMLLQNGSASILLYKVGLVMLGTYPLVKFRGARIAELASMVVLLAYAARTIRWAACYELYAAAFSGDLNVANLELGTAVTPH